MAVIELICFSWLVLVFKKKSRLFTWAGSYFPVTLLFEPWLALSLLFAQPFSNTHCPFMSCVPSQLLSPLQGPPAPTTQIPICFAVLLPSVVACAFVIMYTDSEANELIPSIKSRSTLLMLFLSAVLLIHIHPFFIRILSCCPKGWLYGAMAFTVVVLVHRRFKGQIAFNMYDCIALHCNDQRMLI